ncbi:non-homologous end joining protein Ku [Paraburkholderia bannensis]|uniref:non-homologous end joining protein Ku n=1 Tax=Paraburkholderia bannensis TaxID=765414 RepID=UPI000488F182|nr:Ku protein [Paraburkholderia bannensis]
MVTARSIASLSLSFGLVSIPVRLFSATESSATIRFNLLAPDGSRLEQQYVSRSTSKKDERAEMTKGYEFEKGKFVVFTPDELKALEESPTHLVEIVAFVPDKAVDPLYYDRAYFIAPDKRGAKPLLQRALQASGRCALASWNNKGKTCMVQIRATDDGMVFQQLLWSAEVRSLKDGDVEHAPVSAAELKLALQIIAQGESDSYDPDQYENVEQERVLAAIDAKIEGQQIVASAEESAPSGGQVINLMDALRASLTGGAKKKASAARATVAEVSPLPAAKRTRAVKRAEVTPAAAPAKRARK